MNSPHLNETVVNGAVCSSVLITNSRRVEVKIHAAASLFRGPHASMIAELVRKLFPYTTGRRFSRCHST